MFIGPSNITIDTKGRFLFPAKYRDAIMAQCGGEMVVSHDLKGCLTVYTKDYWDRKAQAYLTLPEDAQAFVAHFLGTSEPLTLDNTGRLALTPELRESIQLSPGTAVLRGVGAFFELWTSADIKSTDLALAEQAKTNKPESLRQLVIPATLIKPQV